MKVLLVEDDPWLAEEIEANIQRQHEKNLSVVGPCDNYDDAVKVFLQERPAVAILDISLKKDDDAGIRIAETINRRNPIPFIFLTGLPDKKGFEKAKYTLPCAFLHKPYEQKGFNCALDLAIMHAERKRLPGYFYYPTFIKPLEEYTVWVTTARNTYEPVLLKELIYIEADDHYLKAYTTEHKSYLMFKGTLKNFYRNNLYVFEDFFQLGRSHIINLKYIKKNQGQPCGVAP